MAISQEIIEQWLTFLIANAVDDVLTMGLSDDLGGNVIHINSSIPRHLNLSITNTLKAQVEIVGQPGPPTPDIYHFHIQFVNNQCFFGASSVTLPDDGPWTSNNRCNQDHEDAQDRCVRSALLARAAISRRQVSTREESWGVLHRDASYRTPAFHAPLGKESR